MFYAHLSVYSQSISLKFYKHFFLVLCQLHCAILASMSIFKLYRLPCKARPNSIQGLPQIVIVSSLKGLY